MKTKTKSCLLLILVFLSLDVVFFIYLFHSSSYVNEYSKLRVSARSKETEINKASNCLILKQPCKCLEHREILLCRVGGKYISYTNNKATRFVRANSMIDEKALNTSRFTCGLANLLVRGPNQKVVAYSLYGKEPRYYNKLQMISKQIRLFYPDWVMRIYHDNSIYENFPCDLQCSMYDSNVDFCNVNELYTNLEDYFSKKTLNVGYVNGMMWRWLPFGDDFVDIFSSRDADSLLYGKEIDAVYKWLKTEFYAHIIKDSPYNSEVMSGGLFDINSTVNRNLSDFIYKKIVHLTTALAYNQDRKNEMGKDRRFLTGHVYPLIRNSSMFHDIMNLSGQSKRVTKRKSD